MCIYCTTNNYRKIYENHIGSIPYDEDGRTYEIHHKDGDHSNNDYNNLIAVTIKDHYSLHESQGDWAACLIMSERMELSAEIKSELARKSALERVENGTHNWQDSEKARLRELEKVNNGTHLFCDSQWQSEINRKRVENGTHNLLGGEIGGKASRERVANGTHNWLGGKYQRKLAEQRVLDGTHPWLGGDASRRISRQRVEDGTHNFCGGKNTKQQLQNGNHPSQKKEILSGMQENYGKWSIRKMESRARVHP